MTTLFQRGAAYLESRRPAAGNVPVSYSRKRPSQPGDSTLGLPDGVTMTEPDSEGNVVVSISLGATVGKREYPSSDAGKIGMMEERWDFLVAISDMAAFWPIINYKGDTPIRGDMFAITSDGVNETYEVQPSSDSRTFHPSFGPYGNTWRIHTMRKT